MSKTSLTLARAKELFNYDPLTGVITWKLSRGRVKKGSQAGGPNADGYIVIGADGSHYYAHRLAWLLQTGEWPVGVIDHRNFNTSANWFKNLRDVPGEINNQNRSGVQSNSGTGVAGVHKHKGRYRAQIKDGGRTRYLGTYDEPEVAGAVFAAEKRQIHAGCTI